MIRADRWQPAGGVTLEPNARAAALEMGRCLALTAGPGAGKTELLAQRADFLLQTGGCRYPQRILAISFKVDAARNLKERVRQRCGPILAGRLDSYTFHGFAKRVIDRFRPVLTGVDALDPDYAVGSRRVQNVQITFDDFMPLAAQILESSEVALSAVRQTYSHVFLDEFQDCTGEQYELVRIAFLDSGINVTAVGDTKQRIMGWAGALDGVFLTFATDFKARALNLYQNFRSQPRLRRMQNAMVKVMDPGAAVPDADLVGDSGTVGWLHSPDDATEASSLADQIQGWMGAGVPASEIAVLVSKQLELYAAPLMTELAARGVPYRNEVALQDLSAEPASRLIVDFLTVVVSDGAPDAFTRLMGLLMASGLDDDEAYEAYAGYQRFLDGVRERVRKGVVAASTPAGLRGLAGEMLGLFGRGRLTALSPDYEQGKRLDEVTAETLERLESLLEATGDPGKALALFSADTAVRVMTIHKSKGLEFDTVVLLGVEHETFWGEAVDERAAFFVGISRAKRRLVLTHADFRARPTGWRKRWDDVRTPHAEFLGYATAAK